jgi:hypothetical protein
MFVKIRKIKRLFIVRGGITEMTKPDINFAFHFP